MEPEKKSPLEEEIPIKQPSFLGSMLVFGGGHPYQSELLRRKEGDRASATVRGFKGSFLEITNRFNVVAESSGLVCVVYGYDGDIYIYIL